MILYIQKNEFGIAINLEDQPDLLDIAAFCQRGRGNFWVALEGDEVIGTVGLLDIGNNAGALRKMFVRADRRGSKHDIAHRLFATLLEWCHSEHLRQVYLGTTAQFLAAHRFSVKNGFREVFRSELPDAFPVMTVDTRFYAKTLAAPIDEASCSMVR